FNVTGYRDSTSKTSFPADTLRLAYSPDSLAVYPDMIMRKYSNFHKLDIIITNMYADHGLIDVDTLTALNFVVEGSILTQRYDKRYSGTTYYGLGSPAIFSELSMNYAANFAEVKFNLLGAGVTNPVPIEPMHFELEWLYLDNYKRNIDGGTISQISPSDMAFDFRNNATRVWLDTNYYRIPLIYQKGYIAYRIRTVRPDSNDYRYPVYGAWSAPDSGSLASLGYRFGTIGAAHKNDSLNWQYTVSFAEGGRYKHVLSYFDGLLKNRQSITRFNSVPNRLIATEQVYDFEGRPAISILPTPVQSAAFSYQYGLSKNVSTGLPYKAADFDTMYFGTCPNEVPPAPLHSTALANIYYSAANPDKSGFQKFVPDAGGYPFVQTIYSAGYDKRIDRQGGAGDSLQIGFGHDTRNEYVSADQRDLNMLMGIDAGWADYYRKTVTTDPNGQVSLSVQDYKGRQVSSALIGRGPNPEKFALVSNDNVPDSSLRIDELIRGSRQSVAGNTKTLEKDFYMDVTGYDSIQYIFGFKPMRVCDPGDSSYLSVKAHYNYQVYDECGKTDLAIDNELGVTGVMKTADTVIRTEPMRGIYLTKGTHSLRKELSFNTDDIYAAVDSLMAHPPKCFKNEPRFIKDRVLSENFPCRAELTECELKKIQMKEELWPGKKYGQYTSLGAGVPDVDGGENSIFTRYCHSDTALSVVPSGHVWQPGPAPDTVRRGDTLYFYSVSEVCKYRYQLCQDLGFEGLDFPVNMNTVTVKTFIWRFSDATAERLLPLHPEYCKYKNCFDDTYPGVINSIPSALTAQTNHRFDLDSIIAYDPILPRLTSGPIYFAHARDSLALYRGGKTGIDTMSLMQAYCNSADSVMAAECFRSTFSTPISQIGFVNDRVKELYYQRLRGAYFSNRERFKAYLVTAADSTCAPCEEHRMRLIPASLFSDAFNADGSYNPESEWFKGGVFGADDTTGLSIKDLTGFGGDLTIDSLYRMRDSTALFYDSTVMAINNARIDNIKAAFVNCTPLNKLSALADTLKALILREKIYYGDFTPAHIRYAMNAVGITIGDLCNPYIINYEYHTPPSMPANTGCKSPGYYAHVQAFLNREPIQLLAAATATGASGPVPMTISTIKPFESDLYAVLFHTNITAMATRTADSSVYELKLASPTSDTVRFYFEIHRNACRSILAHSATPSLDTFRISDIRCITETPGVPRGTGYIVNLSFLADIEKRSGSNPAQTCTLLAWNNKVQMTGSAGSLQECVPCTQMLSLYREFTDSMTACKVRGLGHPLHQTMLTNFLNEKLLRIFSWEEYNRFIGSCALADSLPLINYNGYASITLANDAAADAFISYINTLDTVSLTTQLRYKDDSVHLVLDFNSIPLNKLRLVRAHVAAYNTTATVNEVFNPAGGNNFMGWLMVSKGTPFDSVTLRANLSAAFTIRPAFEVQLWTGRIYTPVNCYDFRSKGTASNAVISSAIAETNKFILDQGMAAWFLNRRESTAYDEYSVSEKKSYLQYVYRFAGRKPAFVLDTIQAYYLQPNVFPTRAPQYGSPSGLPDLGNLYLAEAAHPGLSKAIFMLDKAQAHFGNAYVSPSYSEFTDGRIAISGLTAPERLDLFYCGDQSYWYRYFGLGDTLFNIFFRLPAYIPEVLKNDYTLSQVIATPGQGNARSLQLRFNKGSDTIFVNAFTDFTVGNSQVLHDVLLTNAYGQSIPVADTIDNCERSKLSSSIRAGSEDYRLYIDSIRLALRTQFYAYVMSNMSEKLYLGYCDQRHGTTLYYYDRAGNLTRTVPPGGVRKISNRDTMDIIDRRRTEQLITPGVLPLHGKISVYEYNTLDKVIRQNTPDGGEVRYFYDQLGRVIYSQNRKQADKVAYTYTLYDGQGRVTETGEVDLKCGTMYYIRSGSRFSDSVWHPCIYKWSSGTGTGPLSTPPYYSYDNPYIHNALAYTEQERRDYIRSQKRSDVVYTVYDTSAFNTGLLMGINTQENLRKRVSCIKYFEKLPATDTFYRSYTYATHYSYDIAGNVKNMVHDYPYLEYQKQRYKTVDYDYDLASGKVVLLSYNRAGSDQFYQRYSYDDDNRVTKVETSADGYIWKRDAEYQYYQHGPLARASLGDLRVQGIDFAYTIQGWLKAVNGDLLNPAYDMGNDSFGNNVHAYDAAATAINYFKGDYKPIGTTAAVHTAEPARGLYNGNIARLSSDILPFKPLMASFTYDQLNRIKYAVYDSISPAVAGMAGLHPVPAYKSMYDYDADGNITRLIRRVDKPGADRIMDSMRYYYVKGSNRLFRLTDSAENNYVDDVDKFTDSNLIRYHYDPIGNVTKDLVSNQDTIQWNLYNKVTATENRSARNRLRFTYDGAGHRVAKSLQTYTDEGVTAEDNEYFVHDAQGNILAVYRNRKNFTYEGPAVITLHAVAAASLYARSALGDATYIAEALGNDFIRDGSFEAALTPRMLAYEASIPRRPAMHYLYKDPRLTELLIYSASDWVDTLRWIAPQMGNPVVISSSFASAFVDQQHDMARYIMRHFMATPDVSRRTQALVELGGAMDPDAGIGLLRDVHTRLGLPVDSLMDVSALSASITAQQTDADLLAVALGDAMIAKRSEVDYIPFFEQVMMEGGLVGADPYYSQNISQLSQTLLGRYADRNFLRDFFGLYWSKSYDRLSGMLGTAGLYLADYHSDPAAYLTAMSSAISGAFIDTVIASMDGMSLDAYDTRLHAALSGASTATVDIGWHTEKLNLQKNQVLSSETFYLAEHHLYGSSRLGIKNYLEDQLHGYRMWREGSGPSATFVRDTGLLVFRRSWFSQRLNEVISNNERLDYGHFDTGARIFAHTLGQKQYEVTNHLGNVLSTVSDNRYERGLITMGMNGPVMGDSVKVFAPAIPTSYDYYPFGQLMPGRYQSADTAVQPIIFLTGGTTRVLSLPTAIPVGGALAVYPLSGSGAGHSALSMGPDETFMLTTDTIGAGATLLIAVDPGLQTRLDLNADMLLGDPMRASVEESFRDEYQQLHTREIASVNLSMEGKFGMDFVPLGHEVTLRLMYNASGEDRTTSATAMGTGGPGPVSMPGMGYSTFLGGVDLTRIDINFDSWTVKVVNNPRDLYRFGFNGQEKVNEIYGRGTHYDFGERYHDARTGRIGWAKDPLTNRFPSESPYSFAGNSPLFFVDKNGEYKVAAADEARYFEKYPLVMKYLSTMIEKDISNSTKIKDGIMKVNPNVHTSTISGISKWGFGPEIVFTDRPGPRGGENKSAAGYSSKDDQTIELNSRYVKYVEKILATPERTDGEKQLALTRLYMTIIHETSHKLNKLVNPGIKNDEGHYVYPNTNTNGRSSKEVGNQAEEYIWGTEKYQPFSEPKPLTKQEEAKAVEGMSPEKFQPGTTEEVIKEANKTEEGRQSLPTVPTTTP
ncbi:MAG: RHS repeat protein, partial [Chitinophagaceae bacterium]|nr:RHS repeat protein [Chitinophagaceae bacterium]